MAKIAQETHLFEYIKKFIKDGKPVYGTCAGMILLADRVSGILLILFFNRTKNRWSRINWWYGY